MILSVVKVRMLQDGKVRTSYVYGPTPREYASVMASNDGATYKILSVESVHGYKEEDGGRRRRPWWDDGRPTRFFFTKHLRREPLSGGEGEHGLNSRHIGSSAEGGGRGAPDARRLCHDDGEEA